jgi:ubiquinone/menaquinone biosynthesis C-methylase UbiE
MPASGDNHVPGFDHFDLAAPFFDRVSRAPDLTDLIAAADLPADGLLLDAGGGTGRIAEGLTGLAAGVVVADASKAMAGRAGAKAGVMAVQCEAEALPFASGAFARVVMVDAYHHLRNQRRALGELLRVTAQAGITVIEEPDIRHPVVKMIAVAERLLLMRSHFFSAERISSDPALNGAETSIERAGATARLIIRKRAA